MRAVLQLNQKMILADTAHLHEAADVVGLFHKTSVSNIMVTGSGKNNLVARKLHELNRLGGLARPRILMSQGEIDRLAGMQDCLGFVPEVERHRVGIERMSMAETKHFLDTHSSEGMAEDNQDIDGEDEVAKEDDTAEKADDFDEDDDEHWE